MTELRLYGGCQPLDGESGLVEQTRCPWCRWYAHDNSSYAKHECLAAPNGTGQKIQEQKLNPNGRCPNYMPSQTTLSLRGRRWWKKRLPILIKENSR